MSKEPFLVIGAINKHESLSDQQIEENMVPFLTNRAFSLAPDAIFDAAMMNRYPDIDPVTLYHYYINSLPKKSRYSPWPKRPNSEVLELIKQYFKIGSRKALQIAPLFSKQQINEMRQQLDVGGKNDTNDEISGDQTKDS